MISKLNIQNFQSHEDSCLKFCPGVNVIVGKSNVGKTAIIRSLNWILHNRPLGDNFIKRGSAGANVALKFTSKLKESDITITRSKSKSKNEYTVEGVGDKLVLSSFNKNPPPEVSQLINLSDINLQGQFAPYFLVFDPPGQIASYIRSITGMNIIDKVNSVLKSKIGKVKLEISSKEESFQNLKKQLEEYLKIDLDSFEDCLSKSKILLEEIKDLEGKRDKVSYIVTKVEELNSQKINLSEKEFLALEVEANNLVSKLEKERKRFIDIQKILEKVESLSKEIKLPKDISSQIEKSEVLSQEFQVLSSKLLNLNGLVGGISRIETSLEELRENKSKLEKEISELNNQLTVCPLCGSELNDRTKSNLISEEILL